MLVGGDPREKVWFWLRRHLVFIAVHTSTRSRSPSAVRVRLQRHVRYPKLTRSAARAASSSLSFAMFLWWSKDWAPTSPRKGDQHTRAPPSTLMTPTSSSIRRAQIVPRGAGGPGVVFGGEARLMPRGADLVARADAAMSGKSGTVATTTPMSSTRSDALTPSSFFGWTPAFFSWLMPGADEESEQQLSAEKQRVRAALVTVSWCPNSCAVWTCGGP